MKKHWTIGLMAFLLLSCQGNRDSLPLCSSPSTPLPSVDVNAYHQPDDYENYWNLFQYTSLDDETCSLGIQPGMYTGKLVLPSYSPTSLRVVQLDSYSIAANGPAPYVTEIELPATLEKLGDHTLSFANSIHALRIPDGVKEIGTWAFSGLKSLEVLTLPGRMTEIDKTGVSVLSGLKAVFLPKQAKVLGEEAFKDCSRLQTVPLPYGLKTVGASAFEGCVSLREVRVPKSVDLVGDSAYRGCSSLSGLTLEDGVAALGAGAFSKTALRKVFLPKSLASIGAGCFEGCPEDLVIYCEAETRPEGWDAHFDDPRDSHKVVWGAKREDAK